MTISHDNVYQISLKLVTQNPLKIKNTFIMDKDTLFSRSHIFNYQSFTVLEITTPICAVSLVGNGTSEDKMEQTIC